MNYLKTVFYTILIVTVIFPSNIIAISLQQTSKTLSLEGENTLTEFVTRANFDNCNSDELSINNVIEDDISDIFSLGQVISISNEGNLVENKIIWQVPDMKCGDQVEYSFIFEFNIDIGEYNFEREANIVFQNVIEQILPIDSVAQVELQENISPSAIQRPSYAITIDDGLDVVPNGSEIHLVVSILNETSIEGFDVMVDVNISEFIDISSSDLQELNPNSNQFQTLLPYIAPNQKIDLNMYGTVNFPSSTAQAMLVSQARVDNPQGTAVAQDQTKLYIPPKPDFSTFVNCVTVDESEGTFTAYYGYLNRLEIEQTLSRSDFHPSAKVNGSAPAKLASGRHDKAFTAKANIGTNIVWTARAGNFSKTSTASSNYTKCIEEPVIRMCSDGVTPERIYDTLGEWNTAGKPLYLTPDRDNISNEFMSKVRNALPLRSSVPIHNPQYLAADANVNVNLRKNANVWVTFVREDAGYRNVLGYYTYPTNNPPQTVDDIENLTVIFPNASLQGSGGQLNPGDKVNIGKFDSGTSIGWFLVPNGWNNSSQKVNSCGDIYFSNYEFNPEQNPNQRQHNVQLFFEEEEIVLLGFEDLRRDRGSDDDFNDTLFYVSVDPIDAVATEDIVTIEEPPIYECNEDMQYLINRTTTNNKLQRLNRKTNEIIDILPDGIPNDLTTIAISPHTMELFGGSSNGSSSGKIYKINKYTGNQQEVFNTDFNGSGSILDITFHPDGKMWISRNNSGLYSYNIEDKSLEEQIKYDQVKYNLTEITWESDGSKAFGIFENNLMEINPLTKSISSSCGNGFLPIGVTSLEYLSEGLLEATIVNTNDQISQKIEINTQACTFDYSNFNNQLNQLDVSSEICSVRAFTPQVNELEYDELTEDEIEEEQSTQSAEENNNEIQNDTFSTPINIPVEIISTTSTEIIIPEEITRDNVQLSNNFNLETSCVQYRAFVRNGLITNTNSISSLEYTLDNGLTWLPVTSTSGLGTRSVNFEVKTNRLNQQPHALRIRVSTVQGNSYTMEPIRFSLVCDKSPKILGFQFENGFGKGVTNSNGELVINKSLNSLVTIETLGGVDKMVAEFYDGEVTDKNIVGSGEMNYNFLTNLWEISIPNGFVQTERTMVKITAISGEESQTKMLPAIINGDNSRDIEIDNKAGNYAYTVMIKGQDRWSELGYDLIYAGSQSKEAEPYQQFTLPPGEYYIKVQYPTGATFNTRKFEISETSVVQVDTSEKMPSVFSYLQTLFTQLNVDILNSDVGNELLIEEVNPDNEIIKDVLGQALDDFNSYNRVVTSYWTRWDKDSTETLDMYSQLNKLFEDDDNFLDNKLVILVDSNNIRHLNRALTNKSSNLYVYEVTDNRFFEKFYINPNETIIFEVDADKFIRMNNDTNNLNLLTNLLLDNNF